MLPNGGLKKLTIRALFLMACNVCMDDSERSQPFKLQGGMSNELYNTIARVTDGIYEGIRC